MITGLCLVISDEGYPPWNYHFRTWKLVLGICVSLWDGLFSRAFAVSFREAKPGKNYILDPDELEKLDEKFTTILIHFAWNMFLVELVGSKEKESKI